jgi:AraC-like DNA-binding protein
MLQSGQVASRIGQARVLVPMHSHDEALLIVGLRGSATVGNGEQRWTLSPHSMLWLAGRTPHHVQSSSDHHSLILSFPPALVARATGFLDSSGFVHDLVARVSEAPHPERRDRLIAVLLDELSEPLPPNVRLSRVSELVAQRPTIGVAALAREVGLSERSFRRWFQADVGLSFSRWHQERIVERAIERLRRGESVKAVASDLGYANPSAFSAMFRRVMNASPRHYLR